ncbi:hypothetical protein [Isoptericola aurantiacus]|uniref:hypothetical protein n=1 Tax=Isoptericola aurantiacus TaxID=3377839 RepID=UPI00383A2831
MRPDTTSQTSPPPDGGGRHPRHGASADTGPVASVATLFASEPAAAHGVVAPHGPPPEPSAPRPVQTVVLAAALVLALAASAGVAVLWSANRKLAAEVETAVGQAETARQESADLRSELAAAPDAATIDGLADRLAGVEDWTGLPADGTAGTTDLQTRLLEVTNGIDSLESSLQDGLGTVRNDLDSVRDDLGTGGEGATSADLDALRQEIGGLRTAVDEVRQDVGVLCWALGYRSDVAATC